jgi:hypothetical protein
MCPGIPRAAMRTADHAITGSVDCFVDESFHVTLRISPD